MEMVAVRAGRRDVCVREPLLYVTHVSMSELKFFSLAARLSSLVALGWVGSASRC